MKQKIIVYMVVRNIIKRQKLFETVMKQASNVSKDFFIVNHGSDDKTTETINNLQLNINININIINENFTGTMDEMKGKYYKILKEKYGKNRIFLLMLDWDEVLDNSLIDEINNLNFNQDVYLLNINTYLINKVIDKNHFQPRLFEINSVEIAPFKKLHKLFDIKSVNVKKLTGVLHHYSFSSISSLIDKTIFYSKLEAEDLFEKKQDISNLLIFFKFLFDGSKYFVFTLFYHLNFLTLEGWFFSLSGVVYMFYKYLFYLELKIKHQHGIGNKL